MKNLLKVIAVCFVVFVLSTKVQAYEQLRIGPFVRKISKPGGEKYYLACILISFSGIEKDPNGNGELEIILGRHAIDSDKQRFSFTNKIVGVTEIELVPEQQRKLEKLKKEFFSEIETKIYAKVRSRKNGILDSNSRSELRMEVQECYEQKARMAFEVLLPFQVKEFVQWRNRREFESSPYRFLKRSSIKESLELTSARLAKVKDIEVAFAERADDIKLDLKKQIERLRSTAKRDLLGILTADQKRQLENTIGQKLFY